MARKTRHMMRRKVNIKSGTLNRAPKTKYTIASAIIITSLKFRPKKKYTTVKKTKKGLMITLPLQNPTSI